MILPLHILIALTSLGITVLTLIAPSNATLKASYTLVVLTLATGTYLVALAPAHMTQTCITGLVYLGVSFAGIASARYRLERV